MATQTVQDSCSGSGIGKYFKPRTNPGDKPTIKSVLQGEEVKLKTDYLWLLNMKMHLMILI